MTTTPGLRELLGDLSTIQSALRVSKQKYLDLDSEYDARGALLEKALLDQVQNFIDPENRRAGIVKEAARNLVANIKEFTLLRSSLASQVLFLLTQLDLTILSLAKAA